MSRLCECGCGQVIVEKPWHRRKNYHPRFISGHNKSARDASTARWATLRPEPQPCACGCGQLAAVIGQRANRYITGHNARGKRMEASYGWKGGRIVTASGYVALYKPGHHLAGKLGYVLEHRLVWEEANGRRLRPGEDVHHINGDRTDNRPENLVALSKAAHAKAHNRNPGQHLTTEQRSAAGRKGAEARWGK